MFFSLSGILSYIDILKKCEFDRNQKFRASLLRQAAAHKTRSNFFAKFLAVIRV